MLRLRPRPSTSLRGLLAAAVALMALALPAAPASAFSSSFFEEPLAGHWCGFSTTNNYLSDSMVRPNESRLTYLNRCNGVQSEFLFHHSSFGSREPVAFYIGHDNHYNLKQYFRGFNRFEHFKTPTHLNIRGDAMWSISDNGSNLKGGFTTPWFFKGTFERNRVVQHVYAVWVGRRCSSHFDTYVFGCTAS